MFLQGKGGPKIAPLCIQERCQMSLTRLLGALALAAGGTLLLSEWVIEQELLHELTGTSLASLRLACVLAVVLGVFAVRLGRQEEKEYYYKGGRHE
jgi:hypothetical protein